MERLDEYYREAAGNKAMFISLLEKHGYKNAWNGYEDLGNVVRIYIGPPDRYAGFGFKKAPN